MPKRTSQRLPASPPPSPAQEAPGSAAPWFEEGDLIGTPGGARGSLLWLGRFTIEDIWCALEKSGFIKALREKGLDDLVITVEPLDAFLQSLKFYYAQPLPEHLLAEFRLRERQFSPRKRLADPWGGQLPHLLMLEWLLLQNPYAAFTPERPILPGQNFPGLGQSRRILKLLVHLAELLGLEGLANCPQYFHNAFLYRDHFHFYDPEREALVEALPRDLGNHVIAEISWALELGCVQHAGSGKPLAWESDVQIYALSERTSTYFHSPPYRAAVRRAAAAMHFTLDEKRFQQISPLKTRAPR